jgi:glycosyltransferase involved in cell wall biosynthesis
MHILHVDPEMGFSGGEVQVFLLIDGLVERGHTCSVVAQPGSLVGKAARDRGLAVVEIRMRADWDLCAVFRLTRAMRRLQPDLVHLHTGRANWLGGWAAMRAGLPAVSTRRMDRKVRSNWKNRRIYGRFVDRTAAISPAVLKQLRAGGVPSERTEFISSVVDPGRLKTVRSRGVVRAELGLQERDFMVLAAGALVPRKGFDILIEALALLEEKPLLCIAGEGPEREALGALAARLGLASNVRFLGQRADLADCLQAADWFAMPSHAEGLGIAALEAMAMGLPVLASAVGGLGDLVVDQKTGYLLPPGAVNDWASALRRALSDPASAREMGEVGRQRVQDSFLPVHMVEAYEKFYAKVLQARV